MFAVLIIRSWCRLHNFRAVLKPARIHLLWSRAQRRSISHMIRINAQSKVIGRSRSQVNLAINDLGSFYHRILGSSYEIGATKLIDLVDLWCFP